MNKKSLIMKLAAVVVAYRPDENFLRNIKSYIDNIEFLIIWENSPLPEKENYLKALSEYADKILFMGTGKNVGLGKAYNEAIKYVKELDYTHIMTMDQDSYFVNFKGYRTNIENETDETIGMLVPMVNLDGVYEYEPVEAKLGMQSGAVFPLKILDEIGLFREDFFIGGIDHEITFRVRKYGYNLMRYSNCNMIHAVGSGRVVSIFNRQIELIENSPLRRFYTIRNECILFREYPEEMKKDRFFFPKLQIKEALKIILWEKEKVAKISAMLKGTFYGLFSINKPYKNE
jgi:rhamnosyltransferase